MSHFITATTPLTLVKNLVTFFFFISFLIPINSQAKNNHKKFDQDPLFQKVQESLWRNGIKGNYANLEAAELGGISFTAVNEAMDGFEEKNKKRVKPIQY